MLHPYLKGIGQENSLNGGNNNGHRVLHLWSDLQKLQKTMGEAKGKPELKLPISLVDEFDTTAYEHVCVWWNSLSVDDRSELVILCEEQLPMATFPFDLIDEFEQLGIDEDNSDLYEYLVNHEHRSPTGPTLGDRSIPLNAISLLSPFWPHYPGEVRYACWRPTDTLYSQLHKELDRKERSRHV